jgi:hypothetical protein
MAQLTVSAKQTILNDLPPAVEALLKPLENTIVLRMFEKREAIMQVPMGNDTVQNVSLPIQARNYLRKKWSINYDNKTYSVGFVTGENDGKEIFAHPAFLAGKLVLSKDNPEHQIIWKYVQIYPENQDNVLGVKGTYSFYVEDKEADAKREMEKLRKIDNAISFFNQLKKGEIEALSELMHLSGGLEAKKLAMRKICQSSPDTILGFKEDMANIERRALIQAAFNLQIIEVDINGEQIRYTDNKSKAMDFDPNFPPEKQKVAFENHLIKQLRTPEGKKAYEQLQRKVDAHQIALNKQNGAELTIKSDLTQSSKVEL